MLELPVHPRLARLLLAARQCGRPREGAAVAALLSEKDIRARDAFATAGARRGRSATARGTSDVFDRLDRLDEAEAARFGPSLRSRGIDPGAARQVALVRQQLLGRDRHRHAHDVPAMGVDEDDDDAILKWLLLAYPDRVVKRRGAEQTGLMVGGRGVRLEPESVVRDAELFLALDAREDRRRDRWRSGSAWRAWCGWNGSSSFSPSICAASG